MEKQALKELRSIRKNVQFMAWIAILSLSFGFLTFVAYLIFS